MSDSLEFLAFGMLVGGDEEIGPLASSHSHSVVLACLAATNSADRLRFDPPSFGMCGWIDRLVYYLVPFGWVVVIEELDAFDDLPCLGVVESCAVALYVNIVVVGLRFSK